MSQDFRKFALELAQQAGGLIRSNFKLGMKKEWKADSSPVTETDLAINKLLIEGVKKHFPAHSVLGEEESAMVEGSEYTWVCDPVDGTIPFSHGVPTCVFSLALAHNGDPVLGVIYDPFMDRLLWAEKGKGAFMNNDPIHVNDAASPDRTVIGMPIWVRSKYKLIELQAELMERGATVMGLQSVVYMALLTATGEFCATSFGGATAHDGAAVKIIVEEAGGKVTDLFGNEQRWDQPIKGYIASNGKVHAELVKAIGQLIS